MDSLRTAKGVIRIFLSLSWPMRIAVLGGIAILAIVAFSLGLGAQSPTKAPPRAQFQFEPQADDITITLTTGGPLSGGNVNAIGCENTPFKAGTAYTMGETVTCKAGATANQIQIVWTPQGSNDTTTLDTYTPKT